MTVHWVEKITRGAAIALMNNFTSVADALKELVDNPIDYRQGQRLQIDMLDHHTRSLVVVGSDGGRGMDADGIGVWLNWGRARIMATGTSDVGIRAARPPVDFSEATFDFGRKRRVATISGTSKTKAGAAGLRPVIRCS